MFLRRGRSNESGFSLFESVVALAIFALVALASLELVKNNVYAAARLEARTNAAFLAENLMVDTRLEKVLTTTDTNGAAQMGGFDFEWERLVSDTEEAQLKQVVIKIRLAREKQVLSELSGYWHG